MLENLLNTKLKKNLLSILTSNSKRSFSVKELQELTRSGARPVRGTVRGFVDAGIVRVTSKGNRQIFQINQHFPFFKEVSNLLIDNKSENNDTVVKILRRNNQAKLVILTGVFTFQPHMQIDILFVGDSMSASKLHRVLDEIEKAVGNEIHFSTMTLKEFQYRKAMNDRFLRDVLDYPHLVAVNNLRKKDAVY